MDIKIIEKQVSLSELRNIADEMFASEFAKAVVDIEKSIMAIGAGMHVDEEQILLDEGSKQKDLWGINIRFDNPDLGYYIEFDSMINIRPSQNNRSRGVEDEDIQEKIKEIVDNLIIKDE